MLVDTLETKFNASTKGETVALALREHDVKKMRALLDAQPDIRVHVLEALARRVRQLAPDSDI